MAFEPNHEQVRHLALRFDSHDADNSARRLVLSLLPEWRSPDSEIVFVRFTDGITNTLLKAMNKRVGLSSEDIDRDAILLRAYGHGTDLIIDRQREAQNHELLMHHGLAPALLARFQNGMIYRFIRGSVTRPEDLRRPDISAAIARRLAQWHATVPCITHTECDDDGPKPCPSDRPPNGTANLDANGHIRDGTRGDSRSWQSRPVTATGRPEPNIWSVMQKWILALPADTAAERERNACLQEQLEELVAGLSQRSGLGIDGLVFSHNDLLSGNIIVLPTGEGDSNGARTEVTFIDYEYAVPSPAAFDIANHFAEWGGFDCDMSVLPTIAQRRAFIKEYVRSYARLRTLPSNGVDKFDIEDETVNLLLEVDVFRGLPGFYWGIWALIQAAISEIDFDYASYAETRLAEYWAWKAETSGERAASGAEIPLREKRWAQEDDD